MKKKAVVVRQTREVEVPDELKKEVKHINEIIRMSETLSPGARKHLKHLISRIKTRS